MKKSSRGRASTIDIEFLTNTALAAGSTAHIPCASLYKGLVACQVASEAYQCNYPTPRVGSIKGLAVFNNNVPGAGETFVYTVHLDGVATALTVTIPAAGRVGAIVGNVPFTEGQRITVEIVTSAGANATQHSAVVSIEY